MILIVKGVDKYSFKLKLTGLSVEEIVVQVTTKVKNYSL